MTSLSSAVEECIRSPDEENDVSVIVRHSAESADRVVTAIRRTIDVETLHEVPPNYVQITIPEVGVERLCEIEGVERVEFEGSGEVLFSGNR